MKKNTPKNLTPSRRTHFISSEYQMGTNPETDAWITVFFIENHLDHFTYPDHAATPEQIRFMVYAAEDERYYPCSDQMFEAVIGRNQSEFIQNKYRDVLDKILDLIESRIENPREKHYLETLIRIKFRHETRDEIMLPSRLEKRLMKIFINRTQIEDPYQFEKGLRNRRAYDALKSKEFQNALNRMEDSEIARMPGKLTEMRSFINVIELKRLLSLSGAAQLWTTDTSSQLSEEDFHRLMNRPVTGNGWDRFIEFLGIRTAETQKTSAGHARKILWLAGDAGEIVIDLAIIRYLVKLGHKVIVAFKEGPSFTKIDFYDIQEDPVLKIQFDGARLVRDKRIGKNELIKILRSDIPIIVISDGTREELNLILASSVFARYFKEVDAVISRGETQRAIFFDTHFKFTRDIFNISTLADDSIKISYKPHHPAAVKFSHENLEQKANAIIDRMKDARKKGMTIVFYSGIVGSIPGKVKTAKKIMAVFIDHLKTQLAQTFIINPSEYFEPGMDADDLMYMWEIVQRSGLIDIWRFQSYGDIMKAFELINEKVPPEWVGKDATFSTGCTKEMSIAVEVQTRHPEMQIIGPSREKFMRRKEYGIGKMYDRRLASYMR